ncbi:hypothetical protein IAT40_005766 [Kwoniella sp. CBS 6097]
MGASRCDIVRPTKVGFSNPRVIPATTSNAKIKWDTLNGNLSVNVQVDEGSLDLEIQRDQAVMLSRSFRLLSEIPRAQRKVVWQGKQVSIRYEAKAISTSATQTPGHEVIQLIFPSPADVQLLIPALEGYFSIIPLGAPPNKRSNTNAKPRRVQTPSSLSTAQPKISNTLTQSVAVAVLPSLSTPLIHDSETTPGSALTDTHCSRGSTVPTIEAVPESAVVSSARRVNTEAGIISSSTPTMAPTPDTNAKLRASSSPAYKNVERTRQLAVCDSTEDLKRRLLQGFTPPKDDITNETNSISAILAPPPESPLRHQCDGKLPVQALANLDPATNTGGTQSSEQSAPLTQVDITNNINIDSPHRRDGPQDGQKHGISEETSGQAMIPLEESLILFSPIPIPKQPTDIGLRHTESGLQNEPNSESMLSPFIGRVLPPQTMEQDRYLTETQILANELTFDELYPALTANSLLEDKGSTKKRKRDELDNEEAEEQEERQQEKADMQAASLTIETTETYMSQRNPIHDQVRNGFSSTSHTSSSDIRAQIQESLESMVARIVDGVNKEHRKEIDDLLRRYFPPVAAAGHADWYTNPARNPYYRRFDLHDPVPLPTQEHFWSASTGPLMQYPTYMHDPQAFQSPFVMPGPSSIFHPFQASYQVHQPSPALYTPPHVFSARAPPPTPAPIFSTSQSASASASISVAPDFQRELGLKLDSISNWPEDQLDGEEIVLVTDEDEDAALERELGEK